MPLAPIMEAWPIEEVWLRPIVSIAVGAALPWLALRLLRLVAPAPGRARWLVAGAAVACAGLLGATALGPALVDAPLSAPSWGFAALCAAAAALTVWRLPADPAPASDRSPALAWASAATVAALCVAALALPAALTAIPLEAAPLAGSDAARWRLRVHPWDGAAMIAAGWASRRAGDTHRAQARATEAVRMGAPRHVSLELEAELLAGQGRCDEARARFDRALAARAEAAFDEGVPTEPLTLGGFTLPPSLVTECGGLALPSLGE